MSVITNTTEKTDMDNAKTMDTLTLVMRLRAAEALLQKIRAAAILAKAGSIHTSFFIEGVIQELDDAGIK